MVISKILGIMVQKQLVKMNVCGLLFLVPPIVAWVPNPPLKVIHPTLHPSLSMCFLNLSTETRAVQ